MLHVYLIKYEPADASKFSRFNIVYYNITLYIQQNNLVLLYTGMPYVSTFAIRYIP